MTDFKTSTNRSDEALLIEAKRGGRDALGALISRYLPLVYSLSLKYLRDRDEAQDATQETFIKVWRRCHQWREGKAVKPWIMTIAKHTCLDCLKKKRALPFSNFATPDGGNWLQETLETTDAAPDERAEQGLSRDYLRRALSRLPAKYRELLRQHYNADLNLREIAERRAQPVNTVKSQHRRALAALRKLLGAANAPKSGY